MPTRINCGCSAIGSLSQMLVVPRVSSDVDGTPLNFTSITFNRIKRFEFMYERLKSVRAQDYTNAITGSTTRFRRGVRPKSYLVQGVISLQPSPANLEYWLPFITGGQVQAAGTGTLDAIDTEASGSEEDKNITLSSILPEFDILMFRESHFAQYTQCQVAQAVLRGKTSNGGDGSEFLELILVVVGQQEVITTGSAGTGSSTWPVDGNGEEPTLDTAINTLPYTFWEADLEINENAVPMDAFSLRINNNLAINFRNELYPTCIRSTGRNVILDATVPAVCTPVQQILAMNTSEGTAEITLATPDPATMHTQFRLPYAYSKFETPTTNGRGEIMLPVSIEGYGSQGDDELIIQSDASFPAS